MQRLALSIAFSLLFSTAFAPNPSDRCEFGVSAAKESGNAIYNLAVQLYQKIAASKSQDDLIFSPVSIALALALVGSGAEGETNQEIQRLLGAPGSNRLDNSLLYQSLQRQLQINAENAKVNIANGVFYSDQGITLKQEYLNQVQKCFDAKLTAEPFKTNADGARSDINQWVANITNNKIPELFPADSIKADTVAVLANAIYLKAAWEDKFTRTEQLPFYESGKSDKAKTVSFLSRNEKYFYASNNDVSLAGLPYDKVPLTMYVILPKQRDGIGAVEQGLNGERLQALIQQKQKRQVDLKLPKFTIRQSIDLKAILGQLGVQKLFSNEAEFSRMSSNDIKVSAAVHQAYIKVNENGTEAAAATGFKMVPMSASLPQEPVSFVADHPFLYLIVHEPTSAILFMGKVNSPKEE